MKVIGITGGVGCGKSTVLSLIKEHFNAYVIMADDVAKEIMTKGSEGYNAVIEFFGKSILADDGQINKSVLADIIFSNSNKRMVLNSIVHPLVKKKIVEQITSLKIQNIYDYVFVEAALLIEDHYNVFLDEMWYIYAPEDIRKKRLMESRGYSQAKIENIFKSQLSEKEFRDNCDVVIDNGQNLDDTLHELVKLL
ncbi:MAG: dephospho-CoA kinase [Lachnospira sp.]